MTLVDVNVEKIEPLPPSWIKEYPEEFFALEDTPLIAVPHHFSLSDLETALCRVLEVDHLGLESSIPKRHFRQDFGDLKAHHVFEVRLGVVDSPVYVLLSREVCAHLMRHFLGVSAGFPLDAEYLAGFRDFLVAVGIDVLERLLPSGEFTMRVLDVTDLPQDLFLSTSLLGSMEGVDFRLEFLMSSAFEKEWRHYHTKIASQAKCAFEDKIMISLGLQVGFVSVAMQEFTQVGVGDFLLLDHCAWPPGEAMGRAYVTYKGRELYRVSIKREGIKILEKADPREIETELDVDGLESDLDESSVGFSSQEESEAQESQEIPESSLETFRADDMDVSLKVEVGRVEVSLEKLKSFEPGNVIKLNVTPDKGVDLVVGEKVIGRGELLKIGGSIGVRILDIG